MKPKVIYYNALKTERRVYFLLYFFSVIDKKNYFCKSGLVLNNLLLSLAQNILLSLI